MTRARGGRRLPTAVCAIRVETSGRCCIGALKTFGNFSRTTSATTCPLSHSWPST